MNGHDRYLYDWGKYKSDKWKTKRIIKEEIRDLIALGNFSKAELIEIKNIIKQKWLVIL